MRMRLKKILAMLSFLLPASSSSPTYAAPTNSEQAVVVHFQYGLPDLKPLFNLEKQLEAAIKDAKAGEYDGNEISTKLTDGYLYAYGPDADRLFKIMKPLLIQSGFAKNAEIKLRYGTANSGAPQKIFVLQP